ncbi:MAG: PAS domain S-box protein [Nevskia sp.]|nr:PAS domain S-box protein [Nevskia sp.]
MANQSILIVEDEAVIALDLREKLEELGYTVVGQADTGEKALRLAREKKPDLVLMDIRIKGTVDGIDTATVIHRDLRIPVVFMTSFSDGETVRRAALASPYGYLTKPYKIKDLRAALKVALQKTALEAQLRESERWFTSTLRCSTDAVVATDSTGLIDFLNPPAEKLTGWSLEDGRGRPLNELVRFADDEEKLAAAAGEGGGRMIGVGRYRCLVRRDGGEVLVDESVAPLEDEAGNSIGQVIVLREAGKRLTHEQQLRASQAQFRHEHSASATGMALVSLSGAYIQANDALATLLGRPLAELLKENDQELTHPEDLALQKERMFELLGEVEPLVRFEKRYLQRDGSGVLPVSVQASLRCEGGEPLCFVYEVRNASGGKAAAS